MSNTIFTSGANNTVMLMPGKNLSYQSTGVVIYTHTEVDRWHIGDFVSADYIINAEFGGNERETIHATVVAMPGQTSITIFGRTNLSRPLINLRADATNSYAQLIIEPASLDVQGSIVSFFANYAKSSRPLTTQNFIAKANAASWSSATAATSLTIHIPTANLSGNILLGQLVSNSLLPSLATVSSWNPITGTLIINWLIAQSIASASNQQIVFNTSPTQPSNSSTVIAPTKSFKDIEVIGQTTLSARDTADTLILTGNNGINIVTEPSSNNLDFYNQAFTQLAVSGQTNINSIVSNSQILNVASASGITLTTNSSTNLLTITGTIPTITADDTNTIHSYNISLTGTNGILTSIANGKLVISADASTLPIYSNFTDDSTGSSTASTGIHSFKFRGGTGITVAITAQNTLYGDNLLITNTGVTALGGNTGQITADSLVGIVNTSSLSLGIPVGLTSPNTGAFTTLSATTSFTTSATSFSLVNDTATTVNFAGAATTLSIGSSSGTTTINNALTTAGTFTSQQSRTLYVAVSSPGSSATLSFITGGIYYVTGMSQNFTAAFTNVPTASPYVISISMILLQGATPYIPNAVSINGNAQTIKWLGGSVPSGIANRIDTISFSFVITATSTYTVLGSLSDYN